MKHIFFFLGSTKISDEEASKLVAKAMESGYIKQRNTVAIVTGIMGAGKSTFLKRLFRQKLPKYYTSTGVMGESYRGVMGRLASLHTMEYLPRGRVLKFLAPLLKLGIPEGDVEALAQIFMDVQAVPNPPSRSSTTNTHGSINTRGNTPVISSSCSPRVVHTSTTYSQHT